jgi:hypothetical protein
LVDTLPKRQYNKHIDKQGADVNLQQACDIVKEFAREHEGGDLLEGARLMDIHNELGLLNDRERIAIGMFMTAGRQMFAPVDN